MNPILIVEDEQRLAELERDYLIQAGFEVVVINRGDDAVEWLKLNTPSLVVLDLMLPGIDGLDICKYIRSKNEWPIIITTAKVEELDRLIGLELGADDYLCKPFSLREMVARVKAVLRRYNHLTSPKLTAAPQLHILENTTQACLNDISVELTLVEVNLLKVLIAYPRQIFSRDKLIDRIYEDRRVVSDRTIDSHIKKLRKKLMQLNTEHDYIHSVYGAGYRFEPALEEL